MIKSSSTTYDWTILIIAALVFAAPVTHAKPIHPHFYKLEIDGRTSWIVGTIHLPEIKVGSFDESLSNAIQSAQAAYSETGLIKDSDFFGDYVRGTQLLIPLRKRISHGAWQRINKSLKAGVDKSARKFFEYLPAGTHIVTMLSSFPRFGVDPDTAPDGPVFDDQIADLFVSGGMAPLALDEKAYGYRIANRIFTDTHFNAFIMKNIDSNGKWIEQQEYEDEAQGQARKQDIIQEYLAGNELKRPPLEADATPLDRAHREWLDAIYDRHHGWAPTLIGSMKTKATFIFVGKDHLHGEKGLLSLFAAGGIRVTRLNCSNLLLP